jgi:hypothetical protein
MKKRGLDKDIVVLLVSTLITVVSWVGFEVYRAYVKVEVPENIEKNLTELDPVLNKEFFVKLKAELGYEK